GIKKHDFNVEENKEHCHEVKFHTEAGLRAPDRKHPAFIGGVLRRIAKGTFSEEGAGDESGTGKTSRNHDLEEDGDVVRYHGDKKNSVGLRWPQPNGMY